MDTTKLKRFATEARKILLDGVKNRLKGLGFDLETGKAVEEPQLLGGGAIFMGSIVSETFYDRWMSLKHAIDARGGGRKAVREVVEEAAYTWFNRFVAIRIMSQQGFITPVLQYESEDVHIPVIVSEARHGCMPEMTDAQHKELDALINDDAQTNAQFAILIVAFCHSNPVINKCFGAISDWTELLLPQDILRDGGFVDLLNHTEKITEKDYQSSELIGWLYQFYISDRKDEVFAKKGKYDVDEIAPATQIFTPHWIVEYMVQNTIGRIYLDYNPDYYDDFKDKWKYLVGGPSDGTEPICPLDDLTELRTGDLAGGSGHIVGYMFELLFDIYKNEGYSPSDAVTHILCDNIIGLDIDVRAKQLATFALLMKACQKDRRFLDAEVMPRFYAMPEPWTPAEDKNLQDEVRDFCMTDDKTVVGEVCDAITLMNDAQTLGSIMKFDLSDRTRNILQERLNDYERQQVLTSSVKSLIPYVRIILALTEKYHALVMNPPYMGSQNMNDTLLDYGKSNYPSTYFDLGTMFMDFSISLVRNRGYIGMINQSQWTSKKSYKTFRKQLPGLGSIRNFLGLGIGTFDEVKGAVVNTVSFTFQKSVIGKLGKYFDLQDFKTSSDKRNAFSNKECKIYDFDLTNITSLPDNRVLYRLTQKDADNFKRSEPLSTKSRIKKGIATGKDPLFIRNWFEINVEKINFSCSSLINQEWIPINKGGGFRKWAGNSLYVVDWKNDGEKIKNYKDSSGKLLSRPQNLQYMLKEGLVYNIISASGKGIIARYTKKGNMLTDASPYIENDFNIFYVLGLLNSVVGRYYILQLCPSFKIDTGALGEYPTIYRKNNKIGFQVVSNITISKQDWDSHETSWDFEANPLVEMAEIISEQSSCEKPGVLCRETNGNQEKGQNENAEEATTDLLNNSTKQLHEDYRAAITDEANYTLGTPTLSQYLETFKKVWEAKFNHLHANEEELNQQFIDIYGLQDELTPDVPLDEITILQQGEISIEDNNIVWHDDVLIKQLISYLVGVCMGRYRLDKPGLFIAYPNPSEEDLEPYDYNGNKFAIDDDGIIPLLPLRSPFTDNMINRLINMIAIIFGDDNHNENLNYIEQSLGEPLEQYLIKDFWKDHKKRYQNRPIYWLFSSKKGTFQCIAYMHRMNAYTAEQVRTKYLLPYIEYLSNRFEDMQARAADLSAAERRQMDKLEKQIAECREYHDRLHVVADEQIAFDLDDGVVVNYAKFGDVLAKIK